MAFSGLSEKLKHIFAKLTRSGKLTEVEIKAAMREVKLALLEADVNFLVVKDFISKVSEKASGEQVMQSLTPGQQVIKIVHEELTALLGKTNEKLVVSSKPPSVYMMVGLQGAGKTTFCGKFAYMLKGQGKRVLLVACDVYRPAAIPQLRVGAKTAGVEVYEEGQGNPVKIAANGLKHATKNGFDTVIIDTAGRLHINEELMKELVLIKKEVNPTEILLTVDAMTGQDAVNVAKEFNDKLDITGVLLTKLDGDTRGGAALSIRYVTGKPIKFSGVGEKIGDIEAFHPDRIASRILGMGDVVSLVEKAQEAIDQKEAARMAEKMRKADFNLEDFLTQLQQMKKLGSMQSIVGMMPGLSGVKIDDNAEAQMARTEAIIKSMTHQERRKPEVLNGSRRLRIANGSGTKVADVNQLLKQFQQMQKMMRMFKGGGAKKMMSQMKSMQSAGGFPKF